MKLERMLSSESPHNIAARETAIMKADLILLFNLRPWDLREDESQVSLSKKSPRANSSPSLTEHSTES
jgi:hypothetical protein